jgi:flavodoxin
MHNFFIAYAPDFPENRRLAEEIAAAMEAGLFTASCKPAREATIVDIALADFVLFGTQKTGASELSADFDELIRVFKGANLAGKAACLFSFGTEKPSGRLRKAVKETDISLLEEEPVFGDRGASRSGDVKELARRLTAFFQELVNARR